MPKAATFLLDFLVGVAASSLLGLVATLYPITWGAIAILFLLLAISATPAGHEVWCSFFPTPAQAIAMRLIIFLALSIGIILTRL